MQTLEQAEAQVERVQPVDCAIAVFAYNEAAYLPRCLDAVARAGQDQAMDVTVVLNGSTDASPDVAMAAMRRLGLRGRIGLIPQADKSNALNQYIHRLRVPAPLHAFVDAYAAITPDSLGLLARALRDAPEALAAAAVPSTGRSAALLRQQMQAQPGLHGSLFMLRGSFVERMAAKGLRLPLNFYRGDGLLSSMVLHDLDAHSGDWQPHRMVVEPRATWTARCCAPGDGATCAATGAGGCNRRAGGCNGQRCAKRSTTPPVAASPPCRPRPMPWRSPGWPRRRPSARRAGGATPLAPWPCGGCGRRRHRRRRRHCCPAC
jgi:hypothetical protein